MTHDVNTVKSRGTVIAKLAAGYLEDNLQFLKTIDKGDVADFDGKNGYKSGDQVKIHVPAQFTLGTGADITSTLQDLKEQTVTLTVNNQYNVPIAFTSAEIATDIGLKSWSERVLKPAMITLANNVESAALQLAADNTYNSVGTPGSTVFDTDLALSAGERIDINGCADFDSRYLLLNPAANRSAVNARKGLFQSSDAVAKQYKKGAMGMADGFTFLRNNLLPTHTNGADVAVAVEATVLTPATGATSLGVDGVTSSATIYKGSVFTIAGVYAVHPVTKATLPYLKQFVVTADVTETASNSVTMSISPTIYSSASGSLQNVSALPADEAAVTFVGSASTGYAQNMAYHKSAHRFVSLPLQQPDGVDMVGQSTKDGVTCRIVRAYDIKTDKMILRADILWGFASPRAEWSVRAWG